MESGDCAPLWFEVDLSRAVQKFQEIFVETEMSPNGNATHNIKAGLDPNPRQIYIYTIVHSTLWPQISTNDYTLQTIIKKIKRILIQFFVLINIMI